MCPTDFEKELTAHRDSNQQPFLRSCSNDDGNLSDEGSCLHAGSVDSKKVFTKSRPDPSKGEGGGKGKTDTECFRFGRFDHTRAGCRAKTLINQKPTKSAPKGKSVGNCEDEDTETSQNVPLETIDLRSFVVLSDHGDEVEDDESTNETTEMMPPVPPDSWSKRTEMFCGKLRKLCNEDHPRRRGPSP